MPMTVQAVGQDGGDVTQVETAGDPEREAIERALASVPGVMSATVSRSESTGRSRLRLRLAPGEDVESVSWAVAATLRERFGIALDPAQIRPRDLVEGEPAAVGEADRSPHDDPVHLVDAAVDAVLSETRDRLISAAQEALGGLEAGREQPAGPDAARAADDMPAVDPPEEATAAARTATDAQAVASLERAEIRDLDIQRDPQGVSVIATLTHGDRTASGEASSVPTTNGALRAVAEATVGALRGLAGPGLIAGVDRVWLQPAGEPGMATVVISLLTERGEETLLGTCVIRGDAERAVMRATLDGLNRRVAVLLDPPAVVATPQPA